MDNSRQIFIRKTVAGLALAGLLSGLLTMTVLEWLSSVPALEGSGFGLYVPGAVFAVIVSAYFAILLRIRSGAKLLGLLAASVTANLIAFKLTIYIISLSTGWRVATGPFFYGGLFCGGAAGAFVLLGSVHLLFSTQRKWVATLKKASLWSLVAGSLAVVGWGMGGSLGKVLWLFLHLLRLPLSDTDVQAANASGNTNFCSLFALWQMGMAPILGWLISKSAQPQPQSAASSA